MNGLLIQWGRALTDSRGGCDLIFNTSFSNENYIIIPTMGYTSGPEPTGFKKTTITTSSIRVGIGNGITQSGIPMSWVAMGY